MLGPINTFAFGNAITFDFDLKCWIVDATGEELTDKVYKTLICPKCGKNPTAEEHDPCIVNLPGVDFAYCGHGVKDGYVKFTNGILMRGSFDHVQSVYTVFETEKTKD